MVLNPRPLVLSALPLPPGCSLVVSNSHQIMFTCTIQVLHFQLSFQITIYDARRRNHRNRDGVHVVGRRQSRVHDREDRFVDRLPGNVRHGRHTRLQGDLDAEDPARLQVDDLHLPVRFTRRSCGEF